MTAIRMFKVVTPTRMEEVVADNALRAAEKFLDVPARRLIEICDNGQGCAMFGVCTKALEETRAWVGVFGPI